MPESILNDRLRDRIVLAARPIVDRAMGPCYRRASLTTFQPNQTSDPVRYEANAVRFMSVIARSRATVTPQSVIPFSSYESGTEVALVSNDRAHNDVLNGASCAEETQRQGPRRTARED